MPEALSHRARLVEHANGLGVAASSRLDGQQRMGVLHEIEGWQLSMPQSRPWRSTFAALDGSHSEIVRFEGARRYGHRTFFRFELLCQRFTLGDDDET